MYSFPIFFQLWGGGGKPFNYGPNKLDLVDRSGTDVNIMADLRSILLDVKTDQKWSDTKVAVASSCDEPSWARDCIQKFGITDKIKLKDIFDSNLTEIYKGSKSGHLRTIGKRSYALKK